MKRANRAVSVTAAAAAVLMLLSAGTAQSHNARHGYVALGDSYSSGVGSGSYLDEACLRSELAYPSLLAEERRGRFAFAACSGATTEDLLAAQIDRLKRNTGLVTVGIGGNDIDWVTAVAVCMQPEAFDCTPVIEAAEVAIENELPGRLDQVYSQIHDRAPRADVFVLGYPRLFNESEPCGSIPFVAPEEQARMNEAADLLGAVIEERAEAHGFTYVDVIDEFEGHAICDEEEWIHGFTGTVDSFHPTAAGQEGYLAALAQER